jgi:hypothetical protein
MSEPVLLDPYAMEHSVGLHAELLVNSITAPHSTQTSIQAASDSRWCALVPFR